MSILDLDRNLRAKEAWARDGRKSETGYHRMQPPTCTPKNQILVGRVLPRQTCGATKAKPVHGGYPTRVPAAEEWVEVSSKKTLNEMKSEEGKQKKKRGCVVQ